MSTEQFANNAQTNLNGAITMGATSLTVASALGFPSSGQFRILIDSEIMIVTAGAGTTTWTVSRHAEGTPAAAHADQATVTQVLTAGGLENLDASYIGSGTLPIARGGTNSSTALNNNRIMESSGGAIAEGPALTDGQLLIGNTGNAPSATALTAGTGIAITNGAGSITVAGSVFGASGSSHSSGDVPDPGSTAGSTRYLREDATWAVPAGGSGTPPVLATTYNLKVKNNGTSPNTKIDISGGPLGSTYQCILEDSSSPPNTYKSIQSSTITINSGTTGANGLDTGTLAASTWYYFYLIYNGTTVAGLLSTSSSSPTMPSGYTYKALLGAVRTDSSTHFQTFTQFGKKVWIPHTNVFTGTAVTTQGTYQSQSVSSIVPPIASGIVGYFGGNSASIQPCISVAADASGTGEMYLNGNIASVQHNYTASVPFSCPIATSQTFYWTNWASTAAYNVLDISGWEYP